MRRLTGKGVIKKAYRFGDESVPSKPSSLRTAVNALQRIVIIGSALSICLICAVLGTLSVTAHLKSLSAIWSHYWMQGISSPVVKKERPPTSEQR
jgi:hypothetical protein